MTIATVEPARPADAESIYALLVEAFSSSSLPFSIYQARESIGFIKCQIEEDQGCTLCRFQVLRWAGKIAGFYHAVIREDEYFLTQFATSIEIRRRGAGNLLLPHFEAAGTAAGCKTLGLDVFKSNITAAAWYERHGYHPHSTRFRGKFKLSGLVNSQAGELEVDGKSLRQAWAEERRRGFSALTCSGQGKAIRLGLIAGNVCNLLDPWGDDALSVAGAVAGFFLGSRQWLLATSPERFLRWPHAELVEEAVYMKKLVRDS